MTKLPTTNRESGAGTSRVHIYKANVKVPGILGLLLVAPLLLVSASLAALLLVGGGIAALAAPLLRRGRVDGPLADDKTIELAPGEYREIDTHDPRR